MVAAVIPIADLIVGASTVCHHAMAGGKTGDDFAAFVALVVTVGWLAILPVRLIGPLAASSMG